MRRPLRWLGPLVLLMLVPGRPARAWNPHGHRVVTAIAYRSLTPPVKARVAALLRLNPAYGRWVAGVAAADRDLVAFMRASNWADDIREETSGYSPDPPGAKSLTPRLGYRDKHRHDHWHFTNKPYSPDGTRLIPAGTPNVQTQIATLRRSLSSGATDEQKSYDLVWLLHLVGDVHQPLHCAARFTRQQRTGDRGGNSIALAGDDSPHLHAFWDRAGGDGVDPREAMAAAVRLRPAPEALAAIADEAAWVNEGWQEARRSVYALPIGPGPGPYRPTPAYRARAREVAEARLALAGARLARLLNAAVK